MDLSPALLSTVDPYVGLVLLLAGSVAWAHRPTSRTGLLLVLAAALWFAGSVLPAAAYAHRGALVLAVAAYPSGTMRDRRLAIGVVATFGASILAGTVTASWTGVICAACMVGTVCWSVLSASGATRRARSVVGLPVIGLSVVIALDVLSHRSDGNLGSALLGAYDLLVCAAACVLLLGLRTRVWSEATLGDLVATLEPRSTGLAAELGRALGDPSLTIGYRLPGSEEYIDELGRPIDLPPGRTIIPIATGPPDNLEAVLVHDPAVLVEQPLADGALAAARLAIGNARMQADLRSRVDELESSRQRLVEAADAERSQLVAELEQRVAGQLLRAHAQLDEVAEADPTIRETTEELERALAEVRDFAGGIRPAALVEEGLGVALTSLVRTLPFDVSTRFCEDRFGPAIEATMYFAAAEALANITKHARATQAGVILDRRGNDIVLEVSDNGMGGADPGGHGLGDLADRLAALGGELEVADRESGGTVFRVRVPIPNAEAGAPCAS